MTDNWFRNVAGGELPSRLAMIRDLRAAAGLPHRDGLGPEMWAEAIEQVRAWRAAAERAAEPLPISYAEVRARIDAEPYRYEITPMTSRVGWYLEVTKGPTEFSGPMFSFGSRARAVRKAERRIARWARRDARRRRLTVEGEIGP